MTLFRRKPPEPPHHVTFLTESDLIRIAYQKEQQRMTQPQVREVAFHCETCGTQSPYGEAHVCQLTPRQRAKLERAKAADARRNAERRRPERCECGVLSTPGTGHECRLIVDKAAKSASDWQLRGLADALRRSGHKPGAD